MLDFRPRAGKSAIFRAKILIRKDHKYGIRIRPVPLRLTFDTVRPRIIRIRILLTATYGIPPVIT
jgi:hypothetical protein